jgi:hypothetical protein
MKEPSFTIVIPTVNRAYCVGRAIQSALDQTHSDLQILVSDNGSTDDTPAVLAKFTDSRIRFLKHPKTIPAHEHGRFLLDQVQTDRVLILSDDDWLDPGYVSAVSAHWSRYPACALVYTDGMVHYGEAAVSVDNIAPPLEKSCNFIINYWREQVIPMFCATTFRSDLVRTIARETAVHWAGDVPLLLKSAMRGPVGHVALPLAHYTSNLNCGSVKLDPLEHGLELREAASYSLQYLKECGVGPKELRLFNAEAACRIFKALGRTIIGNALAGMPRAQLVTRSALCLFLLSAPLRARLRALPRIFAACVLPRHVLARMVERWRLRRVAS